MEKQPEKFKITTKKIKKPAMTAAERKRKSRAQNPDKYVHELDEKKSKREGMKLAKQMWPLIKQDADLETKHEEEMA